jgi:hypothetical protein
MTAPTKENALNSPVSADEVVEGRTESDVGGAEKVPQSSSSLITNGTGREEAMMMIQSKRPET